MEWILYKTVYDNVEAEIIKSVLEANDIKCVVKRDDAFGFYPSMDLSHGIKIFVEEASLPLIEKLDFSNNDD